MTIGEDLLLLLLLLLLDQPVRERAREKERERGFQKLISPKKYKGVFPPTDGLVRSCIGKCRGPTAAHATRTRPPPSGQETNKSSSETGTGQFLLGGRATKEHRTFAVGARERERERERATCANSPVVADGPLNEKSSVLSRTRAAICQALRPALKVN